MRKEGRKEGRACLAGTRALWGLDVECVAVIQYQNNSIYAMHVFRHIHRNAVWKPLAGFLWFVSLMRWEIVFGLAVSTVAVYAQSHIAVRASNAWMDEYNYA